MECGLLLQMSHVPMTVCVGYTGELCKNSWTDQDADWAANSCESKEPYVRYGSRSPAGKKHF